MGVPPGATELAACRLWPLAKKRALKRKTLTHAEAGAALPGLGQVLDAAWPIHVWCWVRGMPPLNVVIVKRGTTADPEGGFTATDYDVVHEALGRSVYTLEDAWFYPWGKVPDPTPEQLAWSLAAHAGHHQALLEFRLLDLELELRQRDEARGRKRPAPGRHPGWKAPKRRTAPSPCGSRRPASRSPTCARPARAPILRRGRSSATGPTSRREPGGVRPRPAAGLPNLLQAFGLRPAWDCGTTTAAT